MRIDLPVYYHVIFWEDRHGGVHDVPVRFDGGSRIPLLTGAIWDSGQVLTRLLRDRASTSFLSTGSISVCIHIISTP